METLRKMFVQIWGDADTDTAKAGTPDSSSKEEVRSVPVESGTDDIGEKNQEVWWDMPKRTLVSAEGETRFFFHDGDVAANLIELRDRIEEMDSDEYHRYVTDEKNDFAAWVGRVLSDKECAQALLHADSPEEAADIIAVTLKKYDA